MKMVVSRHYLKSYLHNSIQIVCTLMGWVITKWLNILVSDIFMEKSINAVQFKLFEYIYWVSVQNRFPFGVKNYWKWLFPTIMWKLLTQSNSNLVCTLLGWVFRTDLFWATLSNFWPSNGHKITENGGFQLLSCKVITWSSSLLLSTLIGWVFSIDSVLGHVDQIWPSSCQKNNWKWWYLTIIWTSIDTIQFEIWYVYLFGEWTISILGHVGQILVL